MCRWFLYAHCRTRLRGAVQGRAQLATRLARHAGRAAIHHQPGDLLARALAHHMFLVRMRREAFFAQHEARLPQQPADQLLRWSARGRKRQVIGIPGIGEAQLRCHAQQSAIQTAAQQIGEHGTGRSALRQHPLACLAADEQPLAINLPGLRTVLAAQQGQDGGNRAAITELLKDALDAAKRNAGEEILHIQIDHHITPRMRLGVADDRAPGQKPVRRIVSGHLGQDVVEHPILRALQTRHGSGNQALAAGLLRQGERVVMVRARHLAVKAQKAQLGHRHAHRLGELRAAVQRRQAVQGQARGIDGLANAVLTGLLHIGGRQVAGDTRPQIADMVRAFGVPRQRLLVPRLGLLALGLFAPFAGLLHALLAHLAQSTFRVFANGQLLAQLAQFALQFAFALDQVGGQFRLTFSAGPEAHALHLFEDDLLLAGGLDALVNLGTRRLGIAHAAAPLDTDNTVWECGGANVERLPHRPHRCSEAVPSAAWRIGEKKGATRFSSKSPIGSRDGSCSLDATPSWCRCFACGKPLRKSDTMTGVAQ